MSTQSVVRPRGFQKAFSYTRRRGALCLRAALAVPLAVAPMLVGLTPGGVTQVAAVGPPCSNGVLTTTGTTSTCTYTSAGQDTFTVPPGVTTLHIVAIGGKGGEGGHSGSTTAIGAPLTGVPGAPGGAGAVVTSDIPAAGPTLYVEVAANGAGGSPGGAYSGGPGPGGPGGVGGFFGGGPGGT